MKSDCTCSFCSQILKDPIQLPCDDSICREHLRDRNKIKCNECQKEHQVGNIKKFKSCKGYKNLIDNQSYLTQEEKSLKLELKASIEKFFKFYDKFAQNKAQLKSEVFDHFDELRTKINEHREELKKQIDALALEMINQTEKYQQIYLNDLKDTFYSMFDDSKSLANDMNEMEEHFAIRIY
jgi:hypothetical protein